MSLEATLIMLDNSSYALNGDYLPTRWESQVDAASLLIQAKLQANPQSSVGLGLMGGRQVEILCTMTSDSGKVNSYLFGVKVHGELHFTQSLQIGALALKHRQSDVQKQRLVCFIGSRIAEDAQTLKIFAKKLKKNNVAVDLICFGDCTPQQKEKVQTFMNAIKQEDNSHSMFIEPGQVCLSDHLLGSDIFGGGGAGGMGGGMEEQDPQLLQAIRMSLAQSQQQAQQQQQPQRSVQQVQPIPQENRQPTQEELQQLAIRLSLQQAQKAEQAQQQKKQQEGKDKQIEKKQ